MATPVPLPSSGSGLLRVVSPAALTAALEQQKDANEPPKQAVEQPSGLAGLVLNHFEKFRRHRSNQLSGWNERMLVALRAFNGQYDSEKLAEIKKFGGSTVYARVLAMKCRGASALLRDVYLTPDRPWDLAPPEDPDVPPEVAESIQKLVQGELFTFLQAQQPLDMGMVRDRTSQLMAAARDAAKRKASEDARVAADRMDELLNEGGFYTALSEFITDLPLFPFACLKGPFVKMVQTVSWKSGKAEIVQKPRLYWTRVSPFDLYFTPGVASIEDATIIERGRVTRSDLNDLLDLPGYNQEQISKVLEDYGRGGLHDNWDWTDAERSIQESRENPWWNESGMITMLEFHGNVQGRDLIEAGVDKNLIQDPIRDYMTQAWVVGNHVIKAQLSPSPRKRHPYYITSFEKVPGTPVGNGLPDILSDVAEVCNATLRSLVNNASIASGPQVVVNDDRLAPGEDGEELFPWKRWHVTTDPTMNSSLEPVTFFMPSMNVQALLATFNQFYQMADDLSGIPRYLAGSGAPGGAGRTASGLAMLMGNASKILQTVAANVDRDVLGPALRALYDLIMLTDTSGIFSGDEEMRVLGVNVATQRETQRSRQLEFLQQTANPVDLSIIGPKGRAAILRAVSQTLGLDGEQIVPSDQELEAREKAQAAQAQMQQLQQAAAQAQGNQPGQSATGDMGPRENLQQQQPQQAIAGGVQ